VALGPVNKTGELERYQPPKGMLPGRWKKTFFELLGPQ
jgi:hypothetical protein